MTEEKKVTIQNKNTDMIGGGIFRSIFWFSVPLLIGNFFQQLYNTVDSYVVGNYVNTSALAAVGASTPVINMLVGFFMGLSAGAGVVISQYFGAQKGDEMSKAVHASMALTALLSLIFTILLFGYMQKKRSVDLFHAAASGGHRGAGGCAAPLLPVFDDLFYGNCLFPVL